MGVESEYTSGLVFIARRESSGHPNDGCHDSRRCEMTDDSENQKSYIDDGDILAAWVIYIIVVVGLVGYAWINVFG